MAGLTTKASRFAQSLWRIVSGSGTGWSSDSLTIGDALSYPPVWHAVSKITGALMTMDFELLKRVKGGKEVQDDHALSELIAFAPNDYQTAQQWRRQMGFHAIMWGNARSYIRRVDGVPVELIPLDPECSWSRMVRVENPEEGTQSVQKWHATVVSRDDKLSLWVDIKNNPEKVVYIPDTEVWHVPGLGFDGVEGIELLNVGRRAMGLGVGEAKHLEKQQKKGYGGGLMFEAPPGTFRQESDAKEFLKGAREQFGGTDAEVIGLLREGIKANVLSMNNNDAQFVEQRKFNREEIALLFSLEGILGDSSNASYASEVQKAIAFKTNCLAPWMVAFEAESTRKLLSPKERRKGLYCKYDDRMILRMDPGSLMTFCVQGRTAGILNANECRALFDYNEYEGGDEYGNPNTSTGGPGEQSKQSASKQARAVQQMLAKLIGVEANRCKQGAKAKNFLEWMDDFYSSWELKLADEIESIGGDRQLATDHCAESKARLLAVAASVGPDELLSAIETCVSSWAGRASELAIKIESLPTKEAA